MIFIAFETCDMHFLIDLFRIYVRVYFACRVSTLKSGHHFNRNITAHVYEKFTCPRHLTYDERLSSSKSESLEHRRLYLDLVLYKIVHGFVDINMYDISVSPVTERQS